MKVLVPRKNVYAEDGGEYGIRLGTYLDDVGTGVDLNFYYANYHSKQPYVRFTGQGNMFAGDYCALYRAVVSDNFNLYNGTALDGSFRSTTAGDTLYRQSKIQHTAELFVVLCLTELLVGQQFLHYLEMQV